MTAMHTILPSLLGILTFVTFLLVIPSVQPAPCPEGYWSDDCRQACPLECMGGCKVLTGECLRCPDGYYFGNDICIRIPQCPEGQWSQDCDQSCSQSCQGPCHGLDGQCLDCQPGMVLFEGTCLREDDNSSTLSVMNVQEVFPFDLDPSFSGDFGRILLAVLLMLALLGTAVIVLMALSYCKATGYKYLLAPDFRRHVKMSELDATSDTQDSDGEPTDESKSPSFSSMFH